MNGRVSLFSLLTVLLILSGCAPKSEMAPDFSLSALDDSSGAVTLSSLTRETPVLLVFWASWCPACVEEIPTLNAWVHRYGPKGLKILSINVEETPGQVRDFAASYPMDYPVLLDREGKVAEAYGLTGLPASVLLAKGGEILYYGFSLPVQIDRLLE